MYSYIVKRLYVSMVTGPLAAMDFWQARTRRIAFSVSSFLTRSSALPGKQTFYKDKPKDFEVQEEGLYPHFTKALPVFYLPNSTRSLWADTYNLLIDFNIHGLIK